MSAGTVLVTNTTGGAGLAAAKSLAGAGYRVVTVDFRPLPLGLRSRHSVSNHTVPRENQADFERGLMDLVHRVRPDVYLPLGTRFAFFAAKHLDRLPDSTAVNVPSLDGFMAAYRKSVCGAECGKLGIARPRHYSREEAIQVLEHGGDATVVVKPDCDAGAAAGVRYVRDAASLGEAMSDCEGRFGRAVIEEYIPGGPEAMKTVLLLFSRQSRLAAAFTARKIRHWPETGGLTAASCSTDEERLVAQVLPFFEKWRWRGAAEVELKFDSRDGRHKVIEINPRFPGYLRFPIECGLDFPVLAARLALGDDALSPGGYPAYRTGARYLNPGLFLRTIASGLQRRGAAELRHALRDIRGAGCPISGLMDDPLPLLGRALATLRRTPGRESLFQVSG